MDVNLATITSARKVLLNVRGPQTFVGTFYYSLEVVDLQLALERGEELLAKVSAAEQREMAN